MLLLLEGTDQRGGRNRCKLLCVRENLITALVTESEVGDIIVPSFRRFDGENCSFRDSKSEQGACLCSSASPLSEMDLMLAMLGGRPVFLATCINSSLDSV